MRQLALPCALALTLISMNATADSTRITLYSGDFDAVSQTYPNANMPGLALVTRSLTSTLAAGRSELALDALPIALDTGSVQLSPAQSGLRILGQRYDLALAGQDQLLQAAIGERIVVEQSDGGQLRRHTGMLLATGNGLTLRTDDGKIKVLANYSAFELDRAPASLVARPTLRWQLDGPKAGPQQFRLDYATGGLAWQAEYLARVDGPAQDCTLSFSGAAQVVNRSGLDYSDTTLTLVAGEPNRARPAAMAEVAAAPMMMRAKMADAYETAPQAQASGEYHAYPLAAPVDLPNGSVQRLPLLETRPSIACKRIHEAGSHGNGYRPARPQIQALAGEERLPVGTTLAFTNDTASGLGIPLPAGRVRVFEAGRQEDALLGEARIDHTATGQPVRLGLGQSFDLDVRRVRSEAQLSADRLNLTETVRLSVSNAKPQPAVVRIHEPLTRWQDWSITQSDAEWERIDATTIAFDVNVPAGKEAHLTYTVRYRWPENVRP